MSRAMISYISLPGCFAAQEGTSSGEGIPSADLQIAPTFPLSTRPACCIAYLSAPCIALRDGMPDSGRSTSQSFLHLRDMSAPWTAKESVCST